MQITCESCGAPIDADDVNLDTGVAKCTACNAVFRFEEQLARENEETERRNAGRPQPKSVTVDPAGGGVTYRHRWFSWKIVFFTVFCLFWDSFLVFWYAMAFRDPDPMALLLPLIHLAVGVGLTYFTIAGYVNSTTVHLDRGHLSVRHGPLPWPGQVDVGTKDLRQLFCEERVTRGKNGPNYSYRLHAVLADGTRRKLLSGLDTPEVPRYLEQQLEARLQITDRPVRGELRV